MICLNFELHCSVFDMFLMVSQRLIGAVVAVGGGRISRADVNYSLLLKIPVMWIKAKPKYPRALWDGSGEDGSDWGPVNDLLQKIDDRGALITKGMWSFMDDSM